MMFAIKITNVYTNRSYLYPVIYESEYDCISAISGADKKIKQIPQAKGNNILTVIQWT